MSLDPRGQISIIELLILTIFYCCFQFVEKLVFSWDSIVKISLFIKYNEFTNNVYTANVKSTLLVSLVIFVWLKFHCL